MEALRKKQIHLVGTILVILFNGMAAFQFTESTFGTERYNVLDSL